MAEQAKITVHPSFEIGEISPRLFSTFLEPIGTMVNGTMFNPKHSTADEQGFRQDFIQALRGTGMPAAVAFRIFVPGAKLPWAVHLIPQIPDLHAVWLFVTVFTAQIRRASSASFMDHYPQWEETVLQECYDSVDYLSMHHYHSAPPGDIKALLGGSLYYEDFINTEVALCDLVAVRMAQECELNRHHPQHLQHLASREDPVLHLVRIVEDILSVRIEPVVRADST